jgi:hypothetical protein
MTTLSANTVRALMRRGWDTVQIAAFTSRTEAECWNALGEPEPEPTTRECLRLIARSGNGHAARWPKPVSLSRVSILED